MSTRTIISIDEEKCNGCGLCIPNCPEGAMQVIDGKARLISDLFCDGLGACVGYCPEGAITLTEREAQPYDEARAMANIAPHGAGTIRAHLDHLAAHGEDRLLATAFEWLRTAGIPVPEGVSSAADRGATKTAKAAAHTAEKPAPAAMPVAHSALSNWPIQMHLLSPMAPRFKGADVLLSADCVAYAVGSFHGSMLEGKALAIACPKLDEGMDIYREKITALIDHAQIASLTVVMMQVPCCRGLLAVAQQAREQAHRPIPLKAVVVSIDDGSVLSEQTV
jgi:Pyruvate/2-oxoacid:ferredoxin oxidoreductase delta subunit